MIVASRSEASVVVVAIMQDEHRGIFFVFTNWHDPDPPSGDVTGNQTYASSFCEVPKTLADMIVDDKDCSSYE